MPIPSDSTPTPDPGALILEGTSRNHAPTLESPEGGVTNDSLHTQENLSPKAPIDHLTDDALLQVFICLVKQPRGLLPKYPAITLGHVCQRWRTLSLSSPILWTTVSFDLERDKGWKYFGQSLNSFLARSRTLPLDIYIQDNTCMKSDNRIIQVEEQVSALLPCVNRWRTLEIFACTAMAAWYVPLLNCEPASYSQLQVLHMIVPPSISPTTEGGKATCTVDHQILFAPGLRKLYLVNWKSTWPIPPSWTVLRELTLGPSIEQGVIIPLMLACPNLASLTISKYTPPASPLVTPAIVHHSLMSLSISFDKHCSQFSLPQTPALDTLSLVGLGDFPEQDACQVHTSILRILDGCSSNLTDLRLSNCVFREADLTHILRLLPNLKHLNIGAKGSVLTFGLLKRLRPVPDDIEDVTSALGLCPNLVALKLWISGDGLAAADQRIEQTFSLLSILTGRGLQNVHIMSDAWDIVSPGWDKCKRPIPTEAREEALLRESKIAEVSRRIADMKGRGIDDLKLLPFRGPWWRWTRDDLVKEKEWRRLSLSGHIIVYGRS